MTAEKTDTVNTDDVNDGANNCSTECSSTTPYLGTSDINTRCSEDNITDDRDITKKDNDNENDKFTSTSSTVGYIFGGTIFEIQSKSKHKNFVQLKKL